MNNKFSLLFYFSLASVITLIISSLFYTSAPQNIFLLALFLPILFYLLLSHLAAVTHRYSQQDGGEEIIKRIKRNIIYFALGVFAINFSFFTTKQILFSASPAFDTMLSSPEISSLKEEIKKNALAEAKDKELLFQKLQTLSLDIAKLRTDATTNEDILSDLDLTTVLGTNAATLSPTASPSTSVRIKSSQWGLLDVFEDTTATKVVGQIEYGNTYPVLKTEGDYFLINLDKTGNTTTRKGWIHSQFVTPY